VTNEEIVERLERMQDLLTNSVTDAGRNGDGQEYERIREELSEVDGLMEALPRWVRRIRQLGDFWGFVKAQKALPSYASRRTFVADAFRPIIEAYESGESVEAQKFFPKGSDHDAYKHIRAIVQSASSSLFIIDGYMDSTIYTVMSTLASPVAVRLLTSKIPGDFALEGRKFVRQHSSSLEVRTTRDFHDRFIIVDGSECYLLGASIKDAGAKGFTIVPLRDPPVVGFFTDYAERVWDGASMLL
jgi:hypothetical protein